jgi:alginate O-acetyltransferase complex protein AlgI
MSLSYWFRDYVYIPLGGNQCSLRRNILNTLIVWALTGLWHGASWNFVLWGLYWFMFAAAERLFLRRLAGVLPRGIRAVASHGYLLLVAMLGWVLFRFTQFPLAGTVLRGLFGLNGNPLTDFQAVTQGKSTMFLLAFCCVASTPVFRRLRLWLQERAASGAGQTVYQAAVFGILPAAMLLVSTAALVGNSYNPFLYFKF